MKLNQRAVKNAQSLIKAGSIVLESDWSAAQPAPDDENRFLENNSWETYSEWYLGIDEDATEETKSRYGFIVGDFKAIHRDGIVAAKQRAAQYDYSDIEEAADELLKRIDAVADWDSVTEASDESFPASDPPNWRG